MNSDDATNNGRRRPNWQGWKRRRSNDDATTHEGKKGKRSHNDAMTDEGKKGKRMQESDGKKGRRTGGDRSNSPTCC